jgi:hypothetical protein
VGGTSASSPLIAAVHALAGIAATATPGCPYAHPGGLFDVTVGQQRLVHRHQRRRLRPRLPVRREERLRRAHRPGHAPSQPLEAGRGRLEDGERLRGKGERDGLGMGGF